MNNFLNNATISHSGKHCSKSIALLLLSLVYELLNYKRVRFFHNNEFSEYNKPQWKCFNYPAAGQVTRPLGKQEIADMVNKPSAAVEPLPERPAKFKDMTVDVVVVEQLLIVSEVVCSNKRMKKLRLSLGSSEFDASSLNFDDSRFWLLVVNSPLPMPSAGSSRSNAASVVDTLNKIKN